MRVKAGAKQYKVKWKGLNNRYNSWRDEGDLDCNELIMEYTSGQAGTSKVAVLAQSQDEKRRDTRRTESINMCLPVYAPLPFFCQHPRSFPELGERNLILYPMDRAHNATMAHQQQLLDRDCVGHAGAADEEHCSSCNGLLYCQHLHQLPWVPTTSHFLVSLHSQ